MPIDPDDFVLPNTFNRIIDRIEADDLDVLYLGFNILGKNGDLEWKTNYSEQEKVKYSGVEGYSASRGKHVRDPDASYAKIYKNSMIVEYRITYPKDVPYLEDGLFLLKVFSVAEKVGFDSKEFYMRTTRLGSATHSNLLYSDKAINGFILAAKNLKKFGQKISLNKEQLDLINHGIIKFVILPLTATMSDKNLIKYFYVSKKLKREGFSKLTLPIKKNRYYQYGKMYNQSVVTFPFFYIINKYFKKK